MACKEHGHFAVEKGQKILPNNIRNKEGRYMLVVHALGRIFNTLNLIFLYQMKAGIIYFVSRGYKNMSFYEKITN